VNNSKSCSTRRRNVHTAKSSKSGGHTCRGPPKTCSGTLCRDGDAVDPSSERLLTTSSRWRPTVTHATLDEILLLNRNTID